MAWRRAKWEEWANYTRKTRANIEWQAVRGNLGAQRLLREVTENIRSTANYRLKKLEEYGLDYGGVYNDATTYLTITNKKNRFATAKQLSYDYSKMASQAEVGIKFLRSEMSHWQKALEQQEFRIKTLKEHTTLPEDFTRDDQEQFLRFLGNEEVSAAIEEYGNSDIIVDMIYEETKKDSNQYRVIQIALNEYLGGSKTFVEAMKDAGIRIQDYINRDSTRRGVHG